MTQRTFRAVLRSIEHPLLPRLLVLVGIPVACPLPPGAGKVDSAEGMATLEAMSSHHNFRQGTRAKICWFQFCSSPPSIQHQFPSIASGKRSVACAPDVAISSAAIPAMSSFFTSASDHFYYVDYDADAEPQDSSTDLTWSRSRDLLTAKKPRSERRSRHATRTVWTLRAERLDQSGHSGEPSSSGVPQPLPPKPFSYGWRRSIPEGFQHWRS